MPNYKLTYFNVIGRAELARVLFLLAGQEFDDVLVEMPDWPAIKETTPFGQLPVLEVDGKQFAQTLAINFYLAREFGYYGQNNTDRLAIDQVVFLAWDGIYAWAKAMFQAPEESRDEAIKTFLEVELHTFLKMFEKLLESNNSGYFVKDSLTLADLSVWDFITLVEIRLKVSEVAAAYPHLTSLMNKINGLDRLQSYLVSRQTTASKTLTK